VRVVKAANLTLEPQTAAHAAEMFVVLSDPAIYEYENEPPASIEWLRERYARLESRRSADGREQWLNWVIRLPSERLAGYVQATVRPDGHAAIAYELRSADWGRGLASQAVRAMIDELVERYGIRSLSAVLKRGNHRSLRLLQRLGFTLAPPDELAQVALEPDELLMTYHDGDSPPVRKEPR
jgi:ribosomal-protein-alanine N-acetyltransferase